MVKTALLIASVPWFFISTIYSRSCPGNTVIGLEPTGIPFTVSAETNASTSGFIDIRGEQVVVLSVLTVLILIVGFYPQPFFKMMEDAVRLILTRYSS